jgi:hypothetical protein
MTTINGGAPRGANETRRLFELRQALVAINVCRFVLLYSGVDDDDEELREAFGEALLPLDEAELLLAKRVESRR